MAYRKIRWTPLALRDLQEIREYIHRDNPRAARRESLRIRKSTERLSKFPESGRKIGTIPGVREVISGNYRVFYLAESSQVIILRIYHGKRSIPFPLSPTGTRR